MPPVSILHDLASELLQATVDIFADAGIDLPARRYVTDGLQAAADCEQITVAAPRLYVGLPTAEDPLAIHCANRFTLELVVEIVRCVPVLKNDGQPPSAEEIDASALVILSDGYTLAHGLLVKKRAKELFAECSQFRLLDGRPHGPRGGYGGWNQTLRVELP